MVSNIKVYQKQKLNVRFSPFYKFFILEGGLCSRVFVDILGITFLLVPLCDSLRVVKPNVLSAGFA